MDHMASCNARRSEDRGSGAPIADRAGLMTRYGPHGVPAASDMVAPACHSRVSAVAGGDNRHSDKLPVTSIKLKPRDGLTVAWEHEFKDVTRSAGLTALVAEGRPMTTAELLDAASASGFRLSNAELRLLHSRVVAEWWAENARLYDVVFRSIDLSGNHMTSDLRMIEDRFWMGDLRDGIGLLQWVKSFTNSSSVSAQAALTAKVISMKLGSGANLPSSARVRDDCA